MKSPQQIFDDYVSGTISRSEMIQAIADYPFADEPLTDGYDWITPAPDGPTWMEVSHARRRNKITPDNYAEILELRNSRRSQPEPHGFKRETCRYT